MKFVDFKGKVKEDVAFVDPLAHDFWIHSAIIETPVEAAKWRTWWAADHNVWFLFLNEAPCFNSVCCKKEVPAAAVAICSQVESLTWCKVQRWQLSDVGCDSRRRIQLCHFCAGRMKFRAKCQEELDNLVSFTTFCYTDAQAEKRTHVVFCRTGWPIFKIILIVEVHLGCWCSW